MNEPDIFHAAPAAAYRADLAGRDSPFGEHDDVWIVAASTLHLAAGSGGILRRNALFEALGVAIDLLGDEEIDRYVNREWQGEHMYVEALAILADSAHREGALRLAAVMFDDLLTAAPDLTVVEQGRLFWLRARVEWRLGNVEQARARYEHIAALGMATDSAELRARAEIGMISLAQLRGNFPDLERHAQRAAELAERAGLVELARIAYQGVTTAAAKSKEYGKALVAGWQVVQLSQGNPVAEAEALQILGQLLLEAGHPDLARVSFAAVLARPAPSRLLLNALGGLALASAELALEPTVEWSVREVWRAKARTVPRWELAVALFECAVALRRLGRHDEGAPYLREAEEIATAEGFHELDFRAAELRTRAASPSNPPSWRPRESVIVSELHAMAPQRLPLHLEFEAAR